MFQLLKRPSALSAAVLLSAVAAAAVQNSPRSSSKLGLAEVEASYPGALSLVQTRVARHSKETAATTTIPPMMILQRGCSGSSVVMRMTRDMLQSLAVPLYPLGIKEIARVDQPEKNPWFLPGGRLGDAMLRGVEEASQAGQTLLFNAAKIKSWSENEEMQYLNQVLRELKTRVVIVHRNNSLDTVVCEIRDCFVGGRGIARGYPVDTAGNEDQTCFDRRTQSAENKTKALINTTTLPENMEFGERYPQDMQASVTEIGLEGRDIVLFEDLVSHEYLDTNLPRSTSAWMKLLSSLGVNATEASVSAVLSKAVGSYHAPEPHSETVYNIEEVEEFLGKDQSRSWMLRT
mmetsp:Transcript_1750/g.4109  ORF Transcript_1750/g.4109 Transcript_1750/m.4109 type:complete len:347 (+) Transcript_1750:81-1121(+)